MRGRATRVAAGSVAVLVGAAVAVGGAPALAVVGPDRTAGTDVGAAKAVERRVAGGQIRYRPAEASARPQVGREAALTRYLEDQEGPAGGVVSADLELVRYSDDVAGNILADGTVALFNQDSLVWFVRYLDRPVPFYGGMNTPPPVNYPETCDFVDVIDSDTGDRIAGFFDCP